MTSVSVIIPTYNGAKTIKRAIRSVQDQLGFGILFDLEIIAVDDQSTDATQLCLEHLSLDSKVPILRFVNPRHSCGPNMGRNAGLEYARGKWICFLDQDDEWAPNKIKLQLLAKDHPSSIIFTDYVINKSIDPQNYYRAHHYPINETFRNKILGRWDHCPQMSTLMIHHSLSYIRFEEQLGFVDYDYILRLTEGRNTSRLKMPLVTLYKHNNNLSNRFSYRSAAHHYSNMFLTNEYIEKYPELIRKGLDKLNRTMGLYMLQCGMNDRARIYLEKSGRSWKNIFYRLKYRKQG